MADLIINGQNISGLLKEKLNKLGAGWVSLLQVPIKFSSTLNIETMKILQSLGYKGIYITIVKDYISLSQSFKDAGIDESRLFFIDAISKMYGVKAIEDKHVQYVEGPLAIEEITKGVAKLNQEIGGEKKFVFLDSITTLLLYNSFEKSIAFSEFLFKGFKSDGLIGIVVSLADAKCSEKVIEELQSISDEIIDFRQLEDE